MTDGYVSTPWDCSQNVALSKTMSQEPMTRRATGVYAGVDTLDALKSPNEFFIVRRLLDDEDVSIFKPLEFPLNDSRDL